MRRVDSANRADAVPRSYLADVRRFLPPAIWGAISYQAVAGLTSVVLADVVVLVAACLSLAEYLHRRRAS